MIQPWLRVKGTVLALSGLLLLAACDTNPTPPATPIPPAATATAAPATATTAAAPTDTTAPAPTDTAIPPPTPSAFVPNPPLATATTGDGGGPPNNAALQHVLNETSGVRVLAGVPGTPGTIYAGGEKFYRSTDGGATWAEQPAGFPINEIAVAPSDAQILYAGMGEGCASGAPGDLRLSTDGGATWTAVSPGPANIDINPTDPTHLIGIRCDGVYKSTDSGKTWAKLPGTGVTDFDGRFLARGTNARTTIYAAYLSEGGSTTVQRTTDDGRTWQAFPADSVRGLTGLAVDPTDAKKVYALTINGVFASTDGGQTWTHQDKGLERAGEDITGNPLIVTNLAFDPSTTPPTLYLGESGFERAARIRRWVGDHWETVTEIAVQAVRQLVLVKDSAGPALLIGTELGIFRLSLTAPAPTGGGTTPANTGAPGSTTWQHVLTGTAAVQTLAQAPGTPNIVYAGGEKFHRSTDSGATWTTLTPGFAISEMAVAPSDAQIVYAGAAEGCASGTPGALHRSTDGGATWATLTGGPGQLDINPTDPTHLLGIRCDGVYRSTDSGKTWAKLPGTGVPDRAGRYLARGTNDRTIIVAAYLSEGGSTTVQRTTDDGRTWQTVPTDIQGPSSLVVDPLEAKRAYVTAINGFYLSTDAGKTWTPYNEGLRLGPGFEGALSTLSNPALDRVSSSTADGTAAIYLVNYVDAVDTFIVRWDGKDSWVLVTTASRLENVTQLLATNDPKASTLLALSNTGLYRRPLPLPTTPISDDTTPAALPSPAPTVGVWQVVSQQAKDVRVLRTSPAPGGPIYAGGNGVYRSTDGGQTWASISSPFQANEIALAPSDPKVIYAGTGEACYGSITPALYRTADGGTTWTPIAAGPFHFAVSATDPDDLLGLQCYMLVRSRDGKTWPQTAKGDAATSSSVLLARGVDNPATAYVITAGEGGPAHVRRTTNSGASWATLPDPVADFANPQDIQLDPTDARHVYVVSGAGFFASADGGQTWNAHNAGLEATRPEPDGLYHLTHLVLDTSSPPPAGATTTLYLSSDASGLDGKPGQIFRWNGQDAWAAVTDTPTTNSLDPLAFVPDPTHPALLAASGDTIYRFVLR